MIGNVSVIVAIIALFALLLLIVVIDTRLRTWLKSAVIFLAAIAVVASGHQLLNLMGWPASADLPPRFQLISTHIQEPNKADGVEGAIFLWVSELDADNNSSQPRNFITPLTEKRAAEVETAQAMLDQGETVMGEVGFGSGLPDAEGDALASDEGKAELLFGLLETRGDSMQINFSEMPSITLPDKR